MGRVLRSVNDCRSHLIKQCTGFTESRLHYVEMEARLEAMGDPSKPVECYRITSKRLSLEEAKRLQGGHDGRAVFETGQNDLQPYRAGFDAAESV